MFGTWSYSGDRGSMNVKWWPSCRASWRSFWPPAVRSAGEPDLAERGCAGAARDDALRHAERQRHRARARLDKSMAADFRSYNIYVSDAPFSDAAGIAPWNASASRMPIRCTFASHLQRRAPAARQDLLRLRRSRGLDRQDEQCDSRRAGERPADRRPGTGRAGLDRRHRHAERRRQQRARFVEPVAGRRRRRANDVQRYEIFRRKASATYGATPLATRLRGTPSYLDNSTLDGTATSTKCGRTTASTLAVHGRVRPIASSTTAVWRNRRRVASRLDAGSRHGKSWKCNRRRGARREHTRAVAAAHRLPGLRLLEAPTCAHPNPVPPNVGPAPSPQGLVCRRAAGGLAGVTRLPRCSRGPCP